MIYIAVTLLSMLLAYLATGVQVTLAGSQYKSATMSKLFVVCSCAPLMLLSAFRYSTGMDYISYAEIFVGKQSVERYEPSFLLLNRVLHLLSDDPRIFFVVTSCFICGIYLMSIYKYSADPVYSILLFLLSRDYLESYNTVRMFMAIAVSMLAIPYITRKKTLPSLAIIACAVSFHVSAIVMVPLYILYYIRVTPRRGFLILAAAFLFSDLMLRFIRWYTKNFTNLYRYFDPDRNLTPSLSWSYFLIFLSFFLLLSFLYRKKRFNSHLGLMYAASLTGMIITLAGRVVPGPVIRMCFFVDPMVVIFLPEALDGFDNKKLKFVLQIAIALCYLGFWIWVVYFQDSNLLPYRASLLNGPV